MINTVALMGRLTYEPELRTTPQGVSVLRFQIAVDRNYQRAGSERQADFIDCVAWRQTAEFVSRYFRKGSMIAVQGSIQTRNYEDKNGNRRTAVEIVADNVSFCGSKAESGNAGNTARYDEPVRPQAQQSAPAYATGSVGDFSDIQDDDELPF